LFYKNTPGEFWCHPDASWVSISRRLIWLRFLVLDTGLRRYDARNWGRHFMLVCWPVFRFTDLIQCYEVDVKTCHPCGSRDPVCLTLVLVVENGIPAGAGMTVVSGVGAGNKKAGWLPIPPDFLMPCADYDAWRSVMSAPVF
jgi:hypothetical protein